MKDRKYNDQAKKNKRANIDLQNITHWKQRESNTNPTKTRFFTQVLRKGN